MDTVKVSMKKNDQQKKCIKYKIHFFLFLNSVHNSCSRETAEQIKHGKK